MDDRRSWRKLGRKGGRLEDRLVWGKIGWAWGRLAVLRPQARRGREKEGASVAERWEGGPVKEDPWSAVEGRKG